MNKNKIYIIGGVVILIAFVGIMVSLFKSPSSTVNTTKPFKLTVWGTVEDTETMSPLISAFQLKYKNAQITYTQKNFDTYETDLLNALAAGTGPDVFAIHNDWLPKYKDKLTEAPKEAFTPKNYRDAFMDVASDDFVLNSKVYAAPITIDSLALYYNRDILGSAGIAVPARTWEELKNDTKKITDLGDGSFIRRSGVALGTSSNIKRAVDILYLFLLQNKAVPYSPDHSQPTFDQAVSDNKGNPSFPASDALTFFTSFSNPSSDVYTWNVKSNYSVDAFANGELGYMYGYSYLKSTIAQKAPNLNYDIAPAPQPKTGGNLVNYADYWGFAVSKQSKVAPSAWTFISEITSKPSLKAFYTKHLVPTSRKDMVSDQVDTEVGMFASANLTAKSFYKKDAVKVDSIFSDLINDVVLRGKSIEESIATASQKVSAIRLSGEDQLPGN
jgi:ABC-type glycerol-3-phosphate transport system substrate-binding protein